MPEIKLLVVEDDVDQAKCLLALLRAIFSNITIEHAATLEEFETKFNQTNFSLLIVDACLGSPTPNTPKFIEQIVKQGFDGQIIGLSNDENNLKHLHRAGCGQLCLKVNFVSPETMRKIIGPALTKLGLAQE